MNREHHTIDAIDKSLGRIAREAAEFLRGKHRPDYLPYLDQGDFVKIINIGKMKITGKKIKQKNYYKHTQYMGHLKVVKMEDLFEKNPCEVMRRAVYGMLPTNKLRDKMIIRLKCQK